MGGAGVSCWAAVQAHADERPAALEVVALLARRATDSHIEGICPIQRRRGIRTKGKTESWGSEREPSCLRPTSETEPELVDDSEGFHRFGPDPRVNSGCGTARRPVHGRSRGRPWTGE